MIIQVNTVGPAFDLGADNRYHDILVECPIICSRTAGLQGAVLHVLINLNNTQSEL